MTYIKLEDAVKIFNEIWLLDETKIVRLNQLQSIDFDKMIKEMIEENEQRINNINSDDIMWEQDLDRLVWKKRWLQELLNKLPK